MPEPAVLTAIGHHVQVILHQAAQRNFHNLKVPKKISVIRCSHRQCCGSGMFIPDPGSWFLPIPDPGSKISNKRKGWKKICCPNFLCSHKLHKIANYFSFEVLKKKVWANFQRIIGLFTQKIVTKLSKIWVWDPGSGKNLFRIPDQGVKKAPDPGTDPQHWS